MHPNPVPAQHACSISLWLRDRQVRQISSPPSHLQPPAGPCAASVGADNSVGLLSLTPGRPTPLALLPSHCSGEWQGRLTLLAVPVRLGATAEQTCRVWLLAGALPMAVCMFLPVAVCMCLRHHATAELQRSCCTVLIYVALATAGPDISLTWLLDRGFLVVAHGQQDASIAVFWDLVSGRQCFATWLFVRHLRPLRPDQPRQA